MATEIRITCDHCGNRVTRESLVVYEIRRTHKYEEDDEDELGVPRKRGRLPTPPAPTEEIPKRFEVELCPHCLPTWIKRVQNLTAASDVEPKKDKSA